MINTQMYDPETDKSASVVNEGSLAVSPRHYNEIFSIKLDVAAQVYNIVPAKSGYYFVGQVLIMTGNKNIGTSDATVTIYAATEEDGAYAAGTEFLQLELEKNGKIIIPGMNLITRDKGIWVNATTDDDDVYLTLLGYYTKEN